MSNISTTPNSNLIPLIIDNNHLVNTGFKDHFNELLPEVIYNIYLNPSTNELIFQRDSGDLVLDYSLSGLPDVDTSNSSSGNVLTYNGSNWVSKSIDEIYSYIKGQSTRYTDITGVVSVKDALDKILYPYIHPEFTIFNIDGYDTELEIGEYLNGSNGGTQLFNFVVDNYTKVSSTIGYKILDITNNYTIDNNILPTSLNSKSLNIPYGITKNNIGENNVFRIIGKDTSNTFFQKDITFIWKAKIYYGTSALTSLTNNQVINLQNSLLTTQKNNTLNIDANGEYVYFAIPVQLSDIIIRIGNMNNTFWDITTTNITNSFGNTTAYKIYKSKTISFNNQLVIELI